MSRSRRLLDLMQLLRAHRAPVAGARLAAELNVSLRTLYRDIATLQMHGATIEGEAGVGYLLRPGFLLPPLMLQEEELEALVLGVRWVAGHTDAGMALAARNAIAKIAAVLPPERRLALDDQSLLVPGRSPLAAVDLAVLRASIRAEHKLRIDYIDAGGRSTGRTVWPFALGFFEQARVLAAWCEARQAFRHFRTDRIVRAQSTGERYPHRRHALQRQWRQQQGIGAIPV